MNVAVYDMPEEFTTNYMQLRGYRSHHIYTVNHLITHFKSQIYNLQIFLHREYIIWTRNLSFVWLDSCYRDAVLIASVGRVH